MRATSLCITIMAVVVGIFVAAGCKHPSPATSKPSGDAGSLLDQARSSGKATLADFGAPWCPPCVKLGPVIDAIEKANQGKLNVVRISTDDAPDLSKKFGIKYIPVLIFFDKSGKEAHRNVGFIPREEIQKKLDEIGLD